MKKSAPQANFPTSRSIYSPTSFPEGYFCESYGNLIRECFSFLFPKCPPSSYESGAVLRSGDDRTRKGLSQAVENQARNTDFATQSGADLGSFRTAENLNSENPFFWQSLT